jgi:hypothetical protein
MATVATHGVLFLMMTLIGDKWQQKNSNYENAKVRKTIAQIETIVIFVSLYFEKKITMLIGAKLTS